jgi:hypothetical protein
MVGNKSTSLTHWLRSACSRIDRGLKFEFSIEMREKGFLKVSIKAVFVRDLEEET